jgi:hypothetical protein
MALRVPPSPALRSARRPARGPSASCLSASCIQYAPSRGMLQASRWRRKIKMSHDPGLKPVLSKAPFIPGLLPPCRSAAHLARSSRSEILLSIRLSGSGAKSSRDEFGALAQHDICSLDTGRGGSKPEAESPAVWGRMLSVRPGQMRKKSENSKNIPQRLKPPSYCGTYGTAEAVPFQDGYPSPGSYKDY